MGTLPTVRVIGPKGLAIINLSDLEMYRAKGFKTEAEVLAEQALAQEKDIGDMNVAELRKYAEDNDIDISSAKLKPDIIETIREAQEKGEGETEVQE